MSRRASCPPMPPGEFMDWDSPENMAWLKARLERTRAEQLARLKADAPLRPGDIAAQDDVDGLPLFDAHRSPTLF